MGTTKNDHGLTRSNETRGRSDSHKPGNSTRAESNGAPFLLDPVIPKHPSNPSNTGREIGHNARLDSTEVGTECRTAVEPEPPKPEEHGSNNNVRGVVGLVSKSLSAVSPTLAKVDGDGEGGGSGDDVDRSSSGKVESTESVGPAVGVPCPAGEGVVDTGCRDKDEDEDVDELTMIGDGTYCKSRTDLIVVGSKGKYQL